MPEGKLHVIFDALVISRIFYALSAWGGFLNSQQINRINAFLKQLVDLGSAAPHVCDVSEYLRLVDSRLFNRIQSPSHCLSHLLPPEKHHLGLYVPEVTVIHSLYAQIIYVNLFLSPDTYFVFSDHY